jgi:GxxExxY protein
MRVISNINVLTREIIGAGIEVHRELGPALLESAYAPCLERELAARGIGFEHERLIPATYKGQPLSMCYRIDLIVEGVVVVEMKAIEHVLPVHDAQVLTYLQMTGCPLGLLMNFKAARLTDGIKRIVNPRRTTFRGSEIDVTP